jgi:uncharacterized protein (TIGR03067 family)
MRHTSRPAIAVTLALTLIAQVVHANDALLGEWVTTELIAEGRPQDLKRPEWIKIEKGKISFGSSRAEYDIHFPCTITDREIDVDGSLRDSGEVLVLKGLYNLQGGKLRIVWPGDFNDERPTGFDALKDKRVSLYVLKKVAK